MKQRAVAALLGILTLSGCVVINQGEVGVRRVWGKLSRQIVPPGLVFYEAVSTDILKVPTSTVRLRVAHSLPSKEGLNIEAEISILYRVRPDMAPHIIENIGQDYEESVITSVFRSAAADVSARFLAKDMYSAERTNIEREIARSMGRLLGPRGFIIEAVLMKSIRLPEGLARSIEEKLQSEQQAQRMQFVLDRERAEAERKRVEAAGIRDAQKIIADGLTPSLIQWRTIEAFRHLAESPNTKIVITDGRTPLLIDPARK
jgi:regulator of protease activity HflC (stomatin/prohibitin superfamily)